MALALKQHPLRTYRVVVPLALLIVGLGACAPARTSAEPAASSPGDSTPLGEATAPPMAAQAAAAKPQSPAAASDPSVSERSPRAVPGDPKAQRGPARAVAVAPEPAAVASDSPPDERGWGSAAGLRYLEIVRGEASPEQPLPLVIVIHGLGDRPHPGWLRVIDVEPGLAARMVFPQAPTPYSRGFAWFEHRSRDHNEAALAEGIQRAQAQLFTLIERVRAARPTRGRVIVCGFSQGGMLSYALALEHPQAIELALPISGTLPVPMWPKVKHEQGWFPQIIALHGTADGVVSYEADDKLVSHLRSLGYPAELTPFEGVRHHVSSAMSAQLTSELSAAVRRVTQQR